MSSDIQRYRDNLRDELNGAALYGALAAAETDPIRKDLFLQLAQAESSHAQLWRDKLSAAGVQDERFVPGFRTRLLGKLAQRFGPRFVLPTIAATEFADRNKYAGQSDAHAISAEERGHAAVIQAVAANASGAGTTGADIARDAAKNLVDLERRQLLEQRRFQIEHRGDRWDRARAGEIPAVHRQ